VTGSPDRDQGRLGGTRRIVRLAAALVFSKLCLLLLVASTPFLLPGRFNAANYLANFHWPEGPPTLATLFRTWDAQHFLFLSQNGYQRLPPEQAPFNAFYPLWPWLVRAFGGVTPNGHLLASLLLSNGLSLVALLALHRLVRREHGEAAAASTLVLLLAFPSAFVLTLPYSESLFLLLSALLLLGLSEDRPFLVLLAGFLLPLTRALGVFLALPLLVHCWERRAPASRWTLGLAPILGFLAYLGTMYVTTGNAFMGFEVYRYYPGRAGVGKLWNLAAFARAFYPPGGLVLHAFTNSALDRMVFVLFAASLPLVWRLGPTLFAYALVTGLMPAMANGFMSYTRYLLMALPLFVAWGVLLAPPRRRAFRALAIGALGLVQVLLLLRHVHAEWAG
jgi:hypothetical protein